MRAIILDMQFRKDLLAEYLILLYLKILNYMARLARKKKNSSEKLINQTGSKYPSTVLGLLGCPVQKKDMKPKFRIRVRLNITIKPC